MYSNVKAAFAIDEAYNPLRIKLQRITSERKVSEDSRTLLRAFPADCPHVRRFVTAAIRCEYLAVFEEFPAYGSVLLKLASNLRTVIVTAAVYWGFNSMRCLAANISF